MPIYDLEDAVGFINKKNANTVWCYDCFNKSKEDLEDWEMLTEEDLADNETKVYKCDKCGKIIE